ncbi:MAG: FadR/GntR family transcriptional regulator [Telluria sp.]
METHSSPAAARRPAQPRDIRPYQLVAKRIHELVLRSAITPGERLPSERELASALEVSRTTLRQALTSLELGGIVEARSCSGVYLRAALPPEAPGPFELLSARRLIEPELAAMAARVASDSDVEQIRAAAEAIERDQREPADRHFHLTLARASGNAALASMLEHLWSQRGGLWPTLEQLFDADALRDETLADYRRIVCAVAARDPAGARNAMRAHLERYTRSLSRG